MGRCSACGLTMALAHPCSQCQRTRGGSLKLSLAPAGFWVWWYGSEQLSASILPYAVGVWNQFLTAFWW